MRLLARHTQAPCCQRTRTNLSIAKHIPNEAPNARPMYAGSVHESIRRCSSLTELLPSLNFDRSCIQERAETPIGAGCSGAVYEAIVRIGSKLVKVAVKVRQTRNTAAEDARVRALLCALPIPLARVLLRRTRHRPGLTPDARDPVAGITGA